MAFGVKTLKTKNEYTIEEIYEILKQHKFEAGEPSLTQHGPSVIITFPALDRNN